MIFALIGIFTGIIAACISIAVEHLSEWRWSVTQDKITEGKKGIAFIFFALIALLYVSIASVLVAFYEPCAGGSGIPELKSYLNGSN